MPRNGSGTFSLIANSWNPAVNGVTATAADYQALINDVAAAITQSLSVDGQAPMTGNLAMGNNKVTGLATGTANTDAVNLSQVNSNAGQCRLVKSGANIVLQPYQGNRLTINGVVYTIPSAGVSLSPSGSVSGTLYYIYAYMVGAVMTLEYSTTGHTADTTTGVEIKTGDPTRALVGMARPIAGPAWTDTSTQRFVVSWFNQRPVQLQGAGAADYALPTGSLSAINTAFNTEFLSWLPNAVQAVFAGSFITGTGASDSYLSIAVDSAAVNPLIHVNVTQAAARIPASAAVSLSLTEGYHFLTMYGQTTGNPAYVRAASILNVTVMG